MMSDEPEQLPEKPAEPLGIKCPNCHCTDLRVTRTVRREGSIRRERRCRHCHREFITTEFFGFGPSDKSSATYSG